MVTTTKTMETGTLPDSVKASAFGTPLRGISWINQDNSISIKSGFVFNKSLQLIKAPTIKPVSLFSTNSATPNTFYVFHNYCISRINRVYNGLTDFVIALSHKTFLFSRYLLQKFSRTSSAFRLQSAPQIFILGFNVFSLLGIKKLLVGSNCNVVYSNIYPKKSVRTLRNSNFSRKCNMQKHPVKFVYSNLHSLIIPIKILPVIFRNIYWDVFSSIKSGYPDFIKTKSKGSSIKIKWYKFLKNWFSSFIGFSGF